MPRRQRWERWNRIYGDGTRGAGSLRGALTGNDARTRFGTGLGRTRPLSLYVDGPLLARLFGQCSDQIACVHMFGLFSPPHNAGQDGFPIEFKHPSDLWRPVKARSVSSWIDRSHHLLVAFKFWHRLSRFLFPPPHPPRPQAAGPNPSLPPLPPALFPPPRRPPPRS